MIANFSQQATKVKILIDFQANELKLAITFFATRKAADSAKIQNRRYPCGHLTIFRSNSSANSPGVDWSALPVLPFKVSQALDGYY
jgi:hypothetical protein